MGLPLLKFEAALQTKTCPVCFINYAAPELLFEKKLEKKDNWFCPNGHSLVFTGETEAEKLAKEVARLKSEVEWQKGRVALKAKDVIAQKGLAAKAKNKLARVEKGVCPKCNRSFQNVARHMQTQHGIECNQPPEGSKVRG